MSSDDGMSSSTRAKPRGSVPLSAVVGECVSRSVQIVKRLSRSGSVRCLVQCLLEIVCDTYAVQGFSW